MIVYSTEKLVSADTVRSGRCFIYGEKRQAWMVTTGKSRHTNCDIFVPVVRLSDSFEDGIGKDAQVIPVYDVQLKDKD